LRFLYWVYALRLRRQISSHAVPRHIGIILDGNRRYARKHHLAHSRVAYDLGAEKLDDVLAWCLDLGIPAVTLWVCSIDNLKRSRAEVSDILAAVEAKIGALARDPAIYRRGVRVKAVGRLDLLPPSTMTVLREAGGSFRSPSRRRSSVDGRAMSWPWIGLSEHTTWCLLGFPEDSE
jgi:short-chain Z-isoprenyl diphosphate synthase